MVFIKLRFRTVTKYELQKEQKNANSKSTYLHVNEGRKSPKFEQVILVQYKYRYITLKVTFSRDIGMQRRGFRGDTSKMEETAKRRGALLKIIPIFSRSISHNCVKVSTTTTFGTPKLFIKQYFILFCGSFPFFFSLALLLLSASAASALF